MPVWLDWLNVGTESKKEVNVILKPYQEEHSDDLARIKNTDDVRKTYLNNKTTPVKLYKEHILDMNRKKILMYSILLC